MNISSSFCFCVSIGLSSSGPGAIGPGTRAQQQNKNCIDVLEAFRKGDVIAGGRRERVVSGRRLRRCFALAVGRRAWSVCREAPAARSWRATHTRFGFSDGQAPMAAAKVICVGHAALDRIYRIKAFPPEPTKVRAIEHIEVGGGMAANAAVAIARLGGKAELWSRVGDDNAGSHHQAPASRPSGSTSAMCRRFEEARSSTSAIIVDGRGERLIVGMRDTGMPSGTSWLPLERIAEADAVLGDLRWLEATRASCSREARSEGVPTVLDADLGAREALADMLRARRLRDLLGARRCASSPAASATSERLGAGAGARAAPCRRHARRARAICWRERGRRGGHQPAFRGRRGRYDRRRRRLPRRLRADAGRGPPDRRVRARRPPPSPRSKCTRLGGRAGLPTRAELDAFLQRAV